MGDAISGVLLVEAVLRSVEDVTFMVSTFDRDFIAEVTCAWF